MATYINNWRLDFILNALINKDSGEIKRLGEYQFSLLVTLANNAGVTLSKDTLIRDAWKNRVVGANSLPTAIHALRQALGDCGKNQNIIITIPRQGYVLAPEYVTKEKDEEKSIDKDDDEISKIVTQSVEKKYPWQLKSVWLFSLFVVVFGLTSVLIYQHIFTPKTDMTLRQEWIPGIDNINFYHLVNGKKDDYNVAKMLSSNLEWTRIQSKHLVQHHATMKVIYSDKINTLLVSMTVKNQCRQQSQLTMNIENWTSSRNILGEVIAKEQERILNALPPCR